jgi:hypothetical protein
MVTEPLLPAVGGGPVGGEAMGGCGGPVGAKVTPHPAVSRKDSAATRVERERMLGDLTAFVRGLEARVACCQ